MAINSDKLLNRPSELHRRYGGRLAMQKAQQEKMVGGGPSNVVLTKKSIKDIEGIKVNVVKIENILKGTLAAEKKSLDTKKRQESGKRREKQEEKLETKKQAEKGPIKMPKVPRMGFLDWVKNFIGNVILGYFAVRLVDYLPKIKPIIKFLGSAADFIIDVGGKLLNGLVTFVDWGYKAIDFTRGMMKSIGGENFAKVFDGFTGAVGTLVETAIIAATVLATQGDGGVLDVGTDILKDRLLGEGAKQAGKKVATQAAGQVGRTAGLGAGAVAGIVAGAGLLASALGEGAFQLRKVATKPIQDAKKAYDNEKNPLMKIGRGAFLGGMNALLGPLSALGVLLDVVGAPFRYAIELLRFPFLSEEDKKKQANNLAKFDARIREDFRKALNLVTLGFAFKEKGSFGNIYGNKGAQNQMMSKMAGGGITRGGKKVTGARRTISKGTKGKYKRVVPRKPGEVEIKPGADIGGEDKIFGIFPNPLKAAKKVVDSVNPFGVVKTAGEDLGKTDYFGPILAITSKITLGQKPSQRDYENVGLGINMLISKGIQEKQLKGGVVAAFAEGGLVDPDVLSAAETGGDISNWVAKTFQGEIESNAQKTLRMIRENAAKKQSIPQEQQPGVQPSPDSYESGPAGTSGDALTMARNLMRDLGLTEAQAAGIVGNMIAESGVENARPQGSKPGTKGPLVVDGVTGYGIVQWTSKGRQKALYDFAKSMGHDMSKPLTMDIEYKFFLKELRESYGGVLKQIKEAKDTKTASTIFMQQYEIPAGYRTNSKIMERYNLSKPVYDKLAAGQGQATKGKGSYNVPPGLAGTGPGVRSSGSIVNIGKELVSKGFQVAEHPDFTKFKGYTPGRGSVANVHKGKGHYQGRAIDVTDFRGTMEESKARYRSVLNSLYKKPGVSMLIHDSWGAIYPGMKEKYGPGSHGHPTHMHIETAYEEGGETLPYPHLAMVGEEGTEIVIDNDSSVTRAKPMLLAINEAKDERGVMKAIQQYASYYDLAPQTIYVPTPSESEMDSGYGYDSSSDRVAFIPVGDGSDPFEILHQGG